MTSRNVTAGRYIESSPQPSARSSPARTGDRPSRRRHANVYDAVAGRVTTRHRLGACLSDDDDKPATLRDPVLAPDEVLFQRAKAPARYAELDIYRADERLPRGGAGILPDSDLLSAVHLYASRFYDALDAEQPASATRSKRSREGNVDERSMDETALLAFGILLEEAGREVLGRRGDLVFTEGLLEEEEDQGSLRGRASGVSGQDDAESRLPRGCSVSRETTVGFAEGDTFWKRPLAKRRRQDEPLLKAER